MKKLSALLMATLLLFSLCGCKGNEQNDAENQTTTTISETNGTTEAQTATQTTEDFDVLTDAATTTLAATTKNTNTTVTTTTTLPATEQNGGTKPTSTTAKTTTTTTTATTTTTTTTKLTTTTTTAVTPTFLNPKTNIKWEEEYVSKNYKVYDENAIAAGGISFFNDEVDGAYALVLEAMFETENPAERKGVTYNGKTYYRCGAGQNPHRMELTDNEIIIKDSFWENSGEITLRMIVQIDGNLKVTHSKNDLFAVGDILSIDYNGLK